MSTDTLTPEEREQIRSQRREFWAMFDLLPDDEQARIMARIEEYFKIHGHEKTEKEKQNK